MQKLKFLKKSSRVLKLLIVFFLFGLGLLFFENRRNSYPSLENSAIKIVERCRRDNNRQSCYDEEIPKLMKDLSMEEVFEVTSLVQSIDSSYAYCHVLGHELSAIETRKNPNKWRTVVARCPGGVCSNGCVHGAFQERFRAETLEGQDFESFKDEAAILCEEREDFTPTDLEKGSCYHALGHLMMFVTGGDIDKSVISCDEVALNERVGYRPLCYDGAFMQIFQPLEEEDIALVKDIVPETSKVEKFCANYSGEKKTSCWTESWPLFIHQISSPLGAVDFCRVLDGEAIESCLRDIFYILPIQVDFDLKSVEDYCLNLPGEYQGQCISATAIRLIEIDNRNVDKAISFCHELKEENESCFKALANSASFSFGNDSEPFSELCNKIPEQWKSMCIGTEEGQE